jgi:hypothetical protein
MGVHLLRENVPLNPREASRVTEAEITGEGLKRISTKKTRKK